MTRLPSKTEILDWIAQNPGHSAKRDIAKAFGIKGAARIDLKRLLRELESDGHLQKRQKTYRDPDKLPPVSVLAVRVDEGGDLWGDPLEWHGEGDAPRVLLQLRDSDAALTAGDRILAKLREERGDGYAYTGRLIRKISVSPQRMLGIYRAGSEGGRLVPIDKGSDKEWIIPDGASHGARDGELVEAERAGPRARMGLPKARIVTRLGDPGAPKSVSLIAIHQHGIPDAFPDKVINAADRQKPAGLKGREDLRALPLVTIDPSDARDHDDACFVQPDPEAKGGFILWVAIADVAHYVTPGGALDREARKRGNSTYFPDRVVPMLPDRLSGDLCSLHEGVPRATLAVRIRIAPDGSKLSHSFHRGIMTSRASLTYEEVQAAQDGTPNTRCAALMEEVIAPLYGCYAALRHAREQRQPLELDLPERQIVLSDAGEVTSVAIKTRLDAHRMIEEFMVLANVCAAETLAQRKVPLLYRVHEEPSPEKLDALREVAQASGLTLAKGQVLRTAHLNRLLAQAAGGDAAELINMTTLRAMTQAYYSPENYGHFGLALRSYAHFTSPIRRYADLIVHRGLIAAHRWGDDGLSEADQEDLDATAQHISDTERRSMLAERDTTDRYLAAYMSEKIGTELTGRVSGIAKFGLFVKLDDSGADALIPLGTLGTEYFDFDRDSSTLMGAETGTVIGLGARIELRLTEAAPVTGGLVGELLTLDGKPLPMGRGAGRGRGKPARRKAASGRKKAAAKARKVKRVRSRGGR